MADFYPKPPITEAVVEVQFQSRLFPAQITKFVQAVKARYGNVAIPMREVAINVDVNAGVVTAKTSETGTRLGVQNDIAVIRPGLLAVSRTAPYSGWVEFRSRIRNDWADLDGIAGQRTLNRIGVRYINRLDIPVSDDPLIGAQGYTTIAIQAPGAKDSVVKVVGLRVERQISAPEELRAILTAGSVESPLVDKAAFIVDVDIVRVGSIPSLIDDRLALLDLMHDQAKLMFEASITDKARALFQ